MRAHRLLLPACLLLLGCWGDDPAPAEQALSIPEGCNPLASELDCLLPYPSDVFRVEDDSKASGWRVSVPEEAQLHDVDGGVIDMLALHPADGFSVGSQILVTFRQAIDDGALVRADVDPLRSLDDDSPTLLVDAETGERVMHLAELDPRAEDDADRALIVRPLVRLQDAHRYVVAIRGLHGPGGHAIAPPEAFRRLRDGGDTSDPRLAPLAQRYEDDVFAPLTAAGVPREPLQLAWDFSTRTRLDAVGDMLAVREQTAAYFGATPPAVTVISVEEQPDAHTRRRIEATVTVPLFVDSAEAGAQLNRDADGQVVAQGTAEVPFRIVIPESVASAPDGAPPARLLQFGHGFFGDRTEIDGFIAELADERHMVVVAADWWGMSASDRLTLLDDVVGNIEQTMRFTDRLHQGMANFMAVAYAAHGPLADVAEMQIGPAPLYDASRIYFYGISQGGILGGTYLALSPLIERGVLGVGGAGISLMLFRARPFLAFLVLFATKLPGALDQQKVGAMLQASFDRVDPLIYAPLVTSAPLDGGPSDRRVLMQIGVGDTAVPNLAAHLHARAMGVAHLQPAPRAIAGLLPADSPHDGSAIAEFDFGVDPLPGLEAVPATKDNEVHDGTRRLGAAKEQLDLFFRDDGPVVNTCDGVCDPE